MNLHTKHSRPIVFILLLLIHVALIVFWPKIPRDDKNQGKKTFVQLVKINFKQLQVEKEKPPLPPLAIKKRANQNSPISKMIFRPVPNIDTPRIDDVKISESEIAQLEATQANETRNFHNSRTLNTDVKGITLSLKEEFKKQDKRLSSTPGGIEKFKLALANAAIVNRDGVRIENKNLFDGRPVSKVITPFGTYCILHPKAGEKLELTPSSAVPMNCGRL
jgi:hypothetical protein